MLFCKRCGIVRIDVKRFVEMVLISYAQNESQIFVEVRSSLYPSPENESQGLACHHALKSFLLDCHHCIISRYLEQPRIVSSMLRSSL
jgi:hypothetical protein